MKSFTILVIYYIFFIVISCDKNTSSLDSNSTTDSTLRIKYKQAFGNPAKHFSIQFDTLLEDSRCPIGAMCKWEGNAAIGFKFYKDLNLYRFILNTYHGFSKDTTIQEYTIELQNVLPYPSIDSVYVIQDYTTIVRIYN